MAAAATKVTNRQTSVTQTAVLPEERSIKAADRGVRPFWPGSGTLVAQSMAVELPGDQKVRIWTLSGLVLLWLGVYLVMLLTPPIEGAVPASAPHTQDHPPIPICYVLDSLA